MSSFENEITVEDDWNKILKKATKIVEMRKFIKKWKNLQKSKNQCEEKNDVLKYVNGYESSCYFQKIIKTRIQTLIQKTKHQNQQSTKNSYFKFMKNMDVV